MAVAVSEPAKNHTLLFWLIRGVQVLFVGLALLMVALLAWGALLQATGYLRHPQAQGDTHSVIMRITIVLVSGGLSILVPCYAVLLFRRLFDRKVRVQKAGHARKVAPSDVDFFAFMFSAFAALDLHHFLPGNLGASLHVSPLVGAFLHRGLVALLAFFVLKYFVKAILTRLLFSPTSLQ